MLKIINEVKKIAAIKEDPPPDTPIKNIVITDTYLHVNAKIQREMVEKLEFAIHQEEVNTYDVFIEGLKKTLLKQITNETYSSDQTETLKEIYDFINN